MGIFIFLASKRFIKIENVTDKEIKILVGLEIEKDLANKIHEFEVIAELNIPRGKIRENYYKRDETYVFINFYKYLSEAIKNENIATIDEIKENISSDGLLKLSQMCMAIANDNYKGPSTIEIKKSNPIFYNFKNMLLPISLAKKEVKARFKRLVSYEAVIEIVDILNSLRTGNSISNIKKRLKLNVS